MKIYYNDTDKSMISVSVDKLDRIEFESDNEGVDFANVPRTQKRECEKLELKEKNQKMSVLILDLQDEIRGLKDELKSKEVDLKTKRLEVANKRVDLERSGTIISGKDKEIKRLYYELNVLRDSLSATTKKYNELRALKPTTVEVVNRSVQDSSDHIMARNLGFQLEQKKKELDEKTRLLDEKQKEFEIVMKDNEDVVRENNEIRKNMEHLSNEYYKNKSEPYQLKNDLKESRKEYRELKQKNDDFKAMVNEYLNSESMSI